MKKKEQAPSVQNNIRFEQQSLTGILHMLRIPNFIFMNRKWHLSIPFV